MPPVASGSKPSTGKLPPMESKMVKTGLQAPKQTITQKDLFGKLGFQSNNTTMEAINSLLRKNLVTMLRDSKGEITFKFIAKEEAKALGNMDTEEKLVFDHIKNAGNAGIWTKTLTSSTQLPRTTITKVLKILEGKKTVKTVKSVKAPTRKIYMLANLVPSVELTGGPWFTDNELDVEFVGALKRICHKIIQKESMPKRGGSEGKLLPNRITSQLPRVDTIRKFIDSTGVALQVELTDEHVASLLDLMVYEGSIEKIFYPRNEDEDVKPLNGKKLNGKGRKRPHESDDSDGNDRRKKNKGRGKGKAPLKKKKRIQHDSDPDDGQDSDAESEEIDSDEDAEAYRRKKAKLEEEGIETKASKHKRRKKRKAVKNEDSNDDDNGSNSDLSPSSGFDSDSDDDRKGGKIKPKSKSEEDLEAEKTRLAYIYRLSRTYKPVIGWTDIPCGRCPVEQFCTEASRPLATVQPRSGNSNQGRPKVAIALEGGLQGVGMLGGAGAAIGVSTARWGEVKGAVGRAVAPVNPKDCKYYQEWFADEF